MRSAWKVCLTLVAVLCLASSVVAQALTVDNLITLKGLGYSEAEIKNEVQKTGTTLALSPEDAARLKQAGFSHELIAFLSGQSAGAAPPAVGTGQLTTDDVVAMVKAGKDLGEILKAIADAPVRFQLSAGEALDLVKKQVPQAVVVALRGKPLTLDDVKRLAGQGLSPDAWKQLVKILGAARTSLPPAEALSLVQAGVPADVVTALGQGVAPAAKPVVQAQGGVAPVAPAAVTPQPVERRHEEKIAFSEITRTATPGVYEHAGKCFTLRFPEDWHVLRAIRDGEPVYILTPEAGTTDPRKLKVGMQLMMMPMVEQSVLKGKDAASTLEYLKPLIRKNEPGLSLDSPVRAAKIGDIDAASMIMHGTLRDKEGEFTSEMFLTEHEGLIYLIGTQAPKSQYDQYRQVFARVVEESRFGRIPQKRLDESLEARQIVDKYKGSVVAVVAKAPDHEASGSGFIISKDGYVLTNWHVIWNSKENEPYKEFYIEWDDSLGREPAPAKLIGWKFRLSVFQHQWGTDVALMRIEPGDYEPMPLTPLSEVQAGDRVVTMGFPSRYLLEGNSITITTGVVTRFNRGPDGKTETVFTDAPTTHGSSGGPCVSLVTGGVIGLNTFGMDVKVEDGRRHLNDLLDYHGVVPINAAMDEFPLATKLNQNPDGSGLDFFNSYALSKLFMMQNSRNAAEGLATRATTAKPECAAAFCLLGYCRGQKVTEILADQGLAPAREALPGVVEAFQEALKRDPTHKDALVMLAALYEQLGDYAKAAQCADQAIQASPDMWDTYFIRAQLCFDQQQYDEALRYAKEAEKHAQGILPEPLIMTGNILYAKGDLEAGKRKFDEAVELHPANLQARLGQAEYFQRKKQLDQAVGAFKAILKDFKKNPTVYSRIGGCYFDAEQYEPAIQWLDRAIGRFNKLGMMVPQDVLMGLATCFEKLQKPDQAIGIWALTLMYHGNSPMADQMHLKLADLHALAQRRPLVWAHLNRAKMIKDSPQVNQFLQQVPQTPLALADIKTMNQLNYPIPVAADLIENTPLAINVQTDDDITRLRREEGLPVPIIEAILASIKKHGVAAGGAVAPPSPYPQTPTPGTTPTPYPPTPGTTPTPPPTPPTPPPGTSTNPLVGLWMAQFTNAQGQACTIVIQFNPNGQYASQSLVNNMPVSAAQGWYRVNGNVVSGQSTIGQGFQYQFQMQGNVLIMHMPEMGGAVQFVRQQQMPQAPQYPGNVWQQNAPYSQDAYSDEDDD